MTTYSVPRYYLTWIKLGSHNRVKPVIHFSIYPPLINICFVSFHFMVLARDSAFAAASFQRRGGYERWVGWVVLVHVVVQYSTKPFRAGDHFRGRGRSGKRVFYFLVARSCKKQLKERLRVLGIPVDNSLVFSPYRNLETQQAP